MDISSRIHSLEQEIAELTAVLTGLMITYRQTTHRRGLHLKWELITLAGNEWMYGCYEQFLYHCHLFVVPMLWRVNVCFISAMERRNTEANMTEWSKVLRSGRSVFARVGSNPTVCIFPLLLYLFFFLITRGLFHTHAVIVHYIKTTKRWSATHWSQSSRNTKSSIATYCLTWVLLVGTITSTDAFRWSVRSTSNATPFHFKSTHVTWGREVLWCHPFRVW